MSYSRTTRFAFVLLAVVTLEISCTASDGSGTGGGSGKGGGNATGGGAGGGTATGGGTGGGIAAGGGTGGGAGADCAATWAGCDLTTYTDLRGKTAIITFDAPPAPKCVIVSPGQTVEFSNVSPGFHFPVQQCGPVAGVFMRNSSGTVTAPNTEGLYGFNCGLHGDSFAGAIRVKQ